MNNFNVMNKIEVKVVLKLTFDFKTTFFCRQFCVHISFLTVPTCIRYTETQEKDGREGHVS